MTAKVMLIEDDESLSKLMMFLLKMEGFATVSGPRQPDQVLAALRRERPDVVILDVHLGGRQAVGFDLLRSIRGDRELHGTRVLLISGMNYAHQAARSGADAFLSKPFMGDELIAKVRALATASPGT